MPSGVGQKLPLRWVKSCRVRILLLRILGDGRFLPSRSVMESRLELKQKKLFRRRNWMQSSVLLSAHSFPASWKGPFTHAQPEQQTNRTSWRFVHGWRGISQRVISCWWTFGRLRAIASLKDGLAVIGILKGIERYRTNSQQQDINRRKNPSRNGLLTARPCF